jgi:hypothetical protein
MKIFQGILVILSLMYQPAFAERALSSPSGPSQCQQAYELAGQVKTIDNIFNTLSGACYHAGGMRLTHQLLISENSNEPTSVLFTCTGNDQNYVVLSCVFPTNVGEI